VLAETATKETRLWRAWLAGSLEMLFFATVSLWLLTAPAVFQVYYPVVQNRADLSDASVIVQWLSSDHRERSLNLELNGKLVPAELRHYSDVRRVFRWFRPLTVGVALTFAMTLLLVPPSLKALAACQWRGLIFWSGLLLAIGGLAWWDWNHFFALVHHPFFGDQSWRLPHQAYSLRLFPARFWQIVAGAVLLLPLLASASLAVAFAAIQSRAPHLCSRS
jgi:uncharacterized membrane protein